MAEIVSKLYPHKALMWTPETLTRSSFLSLLMPLSDNKSNAHCWTRGRR